MFNALSNRNWGTFSWLTLFQFRGATHQIFQHFGGTDHMHTAVLAEEK
jgi:hypothetical protein